MTATQSPTTPEVFRRAVDGLSSVMTRAEITLGPIRPPQQLAPHTYALGAEVTSAEDVDAFGRLILLHDPDGHEAWDGTLRLVAYVQAEVDEALAEDALLPEVAWSWLVDSLAESGAATTAVGGTVTATSSIRFGDIAGPRRTHQVELRASWTVAGSGTAEDGQDGADDLAAHAVAFCTLLAQAAGLAPAGVSELNDRRG
ncbi:DUF3000 domain-containing protein [Rhodococcus antarcticus]|uniref:DUF3000 domain-containing protein n=1 Tax=Rhodococcus antarcticus TaxID=2987751 RepID=A0ABY6P421_9NOCA|nr:DUF3000 domain-containing protein [Rhodococcus antarcticus]UZJ25918.1 DUF3000 domain-containing protein [Rhodococcus antarcticus]